MLNKKLILILAAIVIFAVACTGVAPLAVPASPADEAENTGAAAEEAESVEDTASAEAETAAAETTAAAEAAAEAEANISSEESGSASAERVAKNGKPLLDDEPRYGFDSYWQTDFSLHTVPYSEILSGGVPRDGIPPIDNPQFVSVADADGWLDDKEPVFVVTVNEETRAYPLQILTWHEIANDTLGGEPIAVTFCPLCNSAITFKRTIEGTVYDFGVSGKLRHSDLIMWDRQTQSWWQQLTGEAIVGELVGEQLTFLPTRLVSWDDFKAAFPEAEVLSRDTGHSRPYGQNPYRGYDSETTPFLFAGETDARLAAMDRVVAVDQNDETVAYPFETLAEERVVADTVGGEAIVVFWEEGKTSALDQASIAGSKDVGAAAVYSPILDGSILDGEPLTFSWDGQSFVDDQTNSHWTIFGQAIEGELAGEQLTPIIHANHFWFAWAAFRPDTRIYTP